MASIEIAILAGLEAGMRINETKEILLQSGKTLEHGVIQEIVSRADNVYCIIITNT